MSFKEPKHLDEHDFDKLADDIKKVNIGQKFMNHVLECKECRDMSLALNVQIDKHIKDLDKLL